MQFSAQPHRAAGQRAGSARAVSELEMEVLEIQAVRAAQLAAQFCGQALQRQAAFVPAAGQGVVQRHGGRYRCVLGTRGQRGAAGQPGLRRPGRQCRQIELACLQVQRRQRPGQQRPQPGLQVHRRGVAAGQRHAAQRAAELDLRQVAAGLQHSGPAWRVGIGSRAQRGLQRQRHRRPGGNAPGGFKLHALPLGLQRGDAVLGAGVRVQQQALRGQAQHRRQCIDQQLVDVCLLHAQLQWWRDAGRQRDRPRPRLAGVQRHLAHMHLIDGQAQRGVLVGAPGPAQAGAG